MEEEIVSDNLSMIITIFASTGFWTFLGIVYANRSKRNNLLLGLAYVQIVSKCEHYISEGEIGINEYKELKSYLFEPYINMGGDGVAKNLIEQVDRLSMKKEA